MNTEATRDLSETHLASQVRKGGDEGVRAAVLLCEDSHPETVGALVRSIYPDGNAPPTAFDALADGYTLYQQTTEPSAHQK